MKQHWLTNAEYWLL